MTTDGMRELAIKLAKENVESEPAIQEVLWFPDNEELRLVEVLPDAVKSEEKEVMAFHFGPDTHGGFPVPMAIALVRPEEVRKIRTPDDWGEWEIAERVDRLAG